MSKFGLILFVFLFTACATAQNQNDALHARDEVLRTLKGFNPSTILKGYTANPQESALQPSEGSNTLGAAGLNALKNNGTASDVYSQAGSRIRVRSNPKSAEMQYAQRLLDNPEDVLDGTCYKEPGVCSNQSVIKTCDESVHYATSFCKDTLDVSIKFHTQQITRSVMTDRVPSTFTFDVTTCPAKDWRCTVVDTVLLASNCEHISVSASRANHQVRVTKQPTCADPRVTVHFSSRGYFVPLQVTVTEYISEDQWNISDCEDIKTGHSNSQCILDANQICLEPNKAKMIGGISIKRPCWGRGYNYQCAAVNSSTCTPLINQGCSQTSSSCIEAKDNRCARYSQTFSCSNQYCMPEKTVCPGKIGCADGQCDDSKNESSDDMSEGLSRLGALAGVAADVSANQVRSGSPSIFSGKNSTCRKVIANARNCCRGSHQMTHCSQDEKRLALAKEEGRAAYVGTYCVKKILTCVEEKESWCVFPTKLSSIIQIQGRLRQLGVNFGWAGDKENVPNCRGITPEELERINFSALDLSPIQQELIARMALPNNGSINRNNQSHIERLKQKERAHD